MMIAMRNEIIFMISVFQQHSFQYSIQYSIGHSTTVLKSTFTVYSDKIERKQQKQLPFLIYYSGVFALNAEFKRVDTTIKDVNTVV